MPGRIELELPYKKMGKRRITCIPAKNKRTTVAEMRSEDVNAREAAVDCVKGVPMYSSFLTLPADPTATSVIWEDRMKLPRMNPDGTPPSDFLIE